MSKMVFAHFPQSQYGPVGDSATYRKAKQTAIHNLQSAYIWLCRIVGIAVCVEHFTIHTIGNDDTSHSKQGRRWEGGGGTPRPKDMWRARQTMGTVLARLLILIGMRQKQLVNNCTSNKTAITTTTTSHYYATYIKNLVAHICCC